MTAEHANAVARLASAAVKLAEEAKSRQAKAPAPIDQAQVAKAAAALVQTGFVEPTLESAAAEALASHAGAVKLAHDLAVKAAETIHKLSGKGNARLAAGEVVGAETPATQDTNKWAAESVTDSEADVSFIERMSQFRVNAR